MNRGVSMLTTSGHRIEMIDDYVTHNNEELDLKMKFNIEEAKLKNLLVQAYEEGWCGSKDLSESVAGELIKTFKKENNISDLKLRKKKKLPSSAYRGMGRTSATYFDLTSLDGNG